jgi:prepilin-type N-terminal cleavage/methylation domain-containing protein
MSAMPSRALRLGRRRAGESGMTLIELMVGLIVMTILSTMVLMGWFSLSRSYSFSISSNNARDDARLAMSRMAREIRDAERQQTVAEPQIVRARARWVEFYSTFNVAGNTSPTMAPRLVMYRLYSDGELWRFEDVDGVDGISGVSVGTSTEPWPANTWDLVEQTTGEGATLLISHVVNDVVPSASNPTALFRYGYYENDGTLVRDTNVYGNDSRSRIVSVEIHLLVDLNPAHSPIYADLLTTAELRNH